MTTAWQRYKEKNGITPLDLLKHRPTASEELAEERMSICQACPELIKATTQCKKCGCFMAIKTKYEAAKCPLGKW
jgi:hypothetical protein